MVGGRGVKLSSESGVLDPELFACVELVAGRRGEHAESLVRQASEVQIEWLAEHDMSEELIVTFDDMSERVTARVTVRYRDLIISLSPAPLPDDESVTRCLVEAASTRLDEALALDRPAVRHLRGRLGFVSRVRPELEVSLDEAQLVSLLPELVAGCTSFAELRALPLARMLEATLDYTTRRALEEDAPARIRVPSGRDVTLSYDYEGPPVLAVPIQELFGCRETPKVARGRVPVMLHLLAPNGRPQQMTRDLEGFWARTYPEVRRELKGRYPKHHWPENPLTATPSQGPKRRRRRPTKA